MKPHFFCLGLLVFSFSLSCSAQTAGVKLNPLIAPGTVSANSVTLLWDKQETKDSTMYEIMLNGKPFDATGKTNYTITGLKPSTGYVVGVRVKNAGTNDKKETQSLKFKTTPASKVYNIVDYGAKNDTVTMNTNAIQAAIDECAYGGTVYIPKGNFISGALYLKSNMTLYLEKGAVLKGSTEIKDYLPMEHNRFEGWELDTYASLLNAGRLSQKGGYNVKNLRITGSGTISGGGKVLGDAMIRAGGLRSRGRLILLMNCQQVSLDGLTITEPPSWTIHYIYSNNISCHNLNIITKGIRNGDGIDPDSSIDCYIFNCTFDTGDDCIAIKSGKNPEGYYIGKPTTNVRITNCDFIRGHGISIGSEMSGGVSGVLVQDCRAGALLHGLQIKGTKDRGGYVKNVTVTDCQLLQITIFSSVNYNNDGDPAPVLPFFQDFVFRNIDLSAAPVKEPVIDINGFGDPAHRLKNVSFNNILLPENAKVVVRDAEKVNFENVRSVKGVRPVYDVMNSVEISY